MIFSCEFFIFYLFFIFKLVFTPYLSLNLNHLESSFKHIHQIVVFFLIIIIIIIIIIIYI